MLHKRNNIYCDNTMSAEHVAEEAETELLNQKIDQLKGKTLGKNTKKFKHQMLKFQKHQLKDTSCLKLVKLKVASNQLKSAKVNLTQKEAKQLVKTKSS